MDEPLFQALDEGAVVLTANRRLAAHLRGAYHRRQRGRGLETWRTPEVLPLGAWIARAWDEAAERAAERGASGEPPVLLGEPVALALWERIILDSPRGTRLFQPEKAAELANDAYRLAHEWRLPLVGSTGSEEARAFRDWTARFEARCREEGWLPAARLPDALAEAIRAGGVALPRRMFLAGFDEIVPQHQALAEALRGAGSPVTEWSADPLPSEAVRTSFPEPLVEIEAVARWARALLEAEPGREAPRSDAPDPVGIVVPDLAGARGRIEHWFRDLLDPGEPLRAASARQPFNISAPLALADAPVVRAALEFLAPKHGAAPVATIGRVLCSPFLAGAERELAARARLDARLRALGAAELTWDAVLRFARGRPGAEQSPILAECLARALERERAQPAAQPAGAWAEAFLDRLRHAFGWPNAPSRVGSAAGDRALDSAEHQAVEAFRAMLGVFAGLEPALPRLTQAEAVGRLRWLAERTEHQPKREPAPVQVLGVLEAGGLRFSHLWLMGFDDSAWPRPPAPNPFLPLARQRERGLPRSSPQRELAYARGQTGRLLACAPRVIASHAEREGERVLAISPLLRALPRVEPEMLPRSGVPRHRDAIHAAAALESLSDFRVPAIPVGTRHGGGVSLFKDQAACPFRAFAVHRLHARELGQPAPGLPAQERGRLAHAAMDRAWETLLTHAALCELDNAALREVAERAAAGAVEALGERRPHWRETRLLSLERERLAGLVLALLKIERARAPFEVVAREARLPARFGGLEIEARLDRMDRLASGGYVVIDYKSGTGALSVGTWFGERPEEPQLPIYCASAGLPIAGSAFVRLSRKALHDVAANGAPKVFVGLTQTGTIFPPDAFPSVRPFGAPGARGAAAQFAEASAAVESWRVALERLGAQFREGDARVDPRHPPGRSRSPCALCPLPALCRVHELARVAEEPDDGDPESGDA